MARVSVAVRVVGEAPVVVVGTTWRCVCPVGVNVRVGELAYDCMCERDLPYA